MSGNQRGDFSRLRFDPGKRYSAVWLQQGRVLLDSDWNEQAAILDHRLRTQTVDLVGAGGAPADAAGFGISVVPALGFDGHRMVRIGDGAGVAGAGDFTFGIRLTVHSGGGTLASWWRAGGDGVPRCTWRLDLHADGGLSLLAALAPAAAPAAPEAEEPAAEPSADGSLDAPEPGAAAELDTEDPVLAADPGSVAAGQEAFLALACGEGGCTLWIGGERVASAPRALTPRGTGDTLVIGAGDEGTGLVGCLHELRLWPQALGEEMLHRAGAGAAAGEPEAGEESGPTLCWRFDRGTGSEVPELTASGPPARLGDEGGERRPDWVVSSVGIGAGRFYVGGLLCELDGDTDLSAQPDRPGERVPAARPPAAGAPPEHFLFYLDAWQRSVSALEDPDLGEAALAGADTTVRSRRVAQVRWLRLAGEETGLDAEGAIAAWRRRPAPPRGRLVAERRRSSALLGNLLYRAEIHGEGGLLGWPRPDDPDHPAVAVTSVVAGEPPTLVLADTDAVDGAWRAGECVEVFSAETDGAAAVGAVGWVTAWEAEARRLTLAADLAPLAGHSGLRVRRIATFKWSRSNAAVAFPVAERAAASRVVRLDDPGRGDSGPSPGDRVEVVDDGTALRGGGFLTTVEAWDPVSLEVTLAAAPPDVLATDPALRPLLRGWDQEADPQHPAAASVPIVHGRALALEDGIEVTFEGGSYTAGDCWLFAARTAHQDIDWPRDERGRHVSRLPDGVEHHLCPLALLTRSPQGLSLLDLRRTFQPLSRGAVSKAGDTMYGPLEIHSDLAVDGDVRVGGKLFGELGDDGVVQARHLAPGAVTPPAVSPAVGVVPAGGAILADSPTAAAGWFYTGAGLTLYPDEPAWIERRSPPGGPPGPVRLAALDGALFGLHESGALWAWEPDGNRWHECRALPHARWQFGLAAAAGRLWVVGGLDGGGRATATLLAYDPAVDRWDSLRPMPTARSHLAATGHAGALYAAGGLRAPLLGRATTTRLEAYDPIADRWTRRRSMPNARAALAAAPLGDRIHVVGGERRWLFRRWGAYFTAAHDVYHPGRDLWLAPAAPLPAPRRAPGLTVAGERLYAAGGQAPIGAVADCAEYDPATGAWAERPPLPAAAAAPGLATIGGRLYAAGGEGDRAGGPPLWECAAALRFYVHRKEP